MQVIMFIMTIKAEQVLHSELIKFLVFHQKPLALPQTISVVLYDNRRYNFIP